MCDLLKSTYPRLIRTEPAVQVDALSIEVLGGELECSTLSQGKDRNKLGTSGSSSNVAAENTPASIAMSHRSEIHRNDKEACLRRLEQAETWEEDLVGAERPADEQLVQYYMDLVQRGETIILKSVQTNKL